MGKSDLTVFLHHFGAVWMVGEAAQVSPYPSNTECRCPRPFGYLHDLCTPDTHRAIFSTIGKQAVGAKDDPVDLDAMIDGL